MQLNGPLMWNMWPQRGKGQIAHLWNLINVCMNRYKDISEGIQRRKRIFLRGACENQCLNCQMQNILWGPHSVKLLSEATIYLVNQYLGQKLFFPENSVGSYGCWQKTPVKCWNDSSLHKPRAYATDLVQIWSLSSFLFLWIPRCWVSSIMESTDSRKPPLEYLLTCLLPDTVRV